MLRTTRSIKHGRLDEHTASWGNLPRKTQLGILTLCRIVDYMQVVSFQTVCYYQLKSFDKSLSEQALSWQSGVASGSFSAAQIFTSMLWGSIADAEWCGRKRVLLIGLLGTGVSCLGLALSRTFEGVVACRLCAGAFHVTIGIVRAMVSENIEDTRHQARAFLLLPAAVMIASILGSTCASWLADPFTRFPALLHSLPRFISGNWVTYMEALPYAPPALFSAFSLFLMGIIVFLKTEETLPTRRNHPDAGLRLFEYCKRTVQKGKSVELRPSLDSRYRLDVEASANEKPFDRADVTLGIGHREEKRSMWTFRIVSILLSQAIFDFHMGAFDSLWPLFLSTPRSIARQSLPIIFNGGLGMESKRVAIALTMVGLIGLVIQFVFYPRVNIRLGNAKTFRLFCLAFPISYGIAPYLVVIPKGDTATMWSLIFLVLTIHTAGRIFVLPATIALLNNCAAELFVLGKVHGLGQMITAIFRTTGPVAAGHLLGVSLERGVIGIVWWTMAISGMMGFFASLFIRERNGSLQSILRSPARSVASGTMKTN